MKLELLKWVARTRDREWIMVDWGHAYTMVDGVVVEIIGPDMYVNGKYVGSCLVWGWRIEDNALRLVADFEDVLEYGS